MVLLCQDSAADGDCKSGDLAQDVSGAGVSGMNETIPEWQLFLDASLGNVTRIASAPQDAPSKSNVHTCASRWKVPVYIRGMIFKYCDLSGCTWFPSCCLLFAQQAVCTNMTLCGSGWYGNYGQWRGSVGPAAV